MFAPDSLTATDSAVALLIHYSFDLGGYTAGELIDHWLQDYPAVWVWQGVIEALYQGRYKAVSVEQILAFWNRRGQALNHYNHEFERLVCSRFPQALTGQSQTRANASSPVPAAVNFSNGDDDPSVVTSGAGEKTPVQLLDATANVSPATNKLGKKPARCRPIEQFTPVDDGSDFYTKLKYIAQYSVNAPDQGTRP